MATGENGPPERGVGGDIDTILVCENALRILPIRETRVEGRGNGAIHRLQGLEDKRIGS